jgi:hypothetical protein
MRPWSALSCMPLPSSSAIALSHTSSAHRLSNRLTDVFSIPRRHTCVLTQMMLTVSSILQTQTSPGRSSPTSQSPDHCSKQSTLDLVCTLLISLTIGRSRVSLQLTLDGGLSGRHALLRSAGRLLEQCAHIDQTHRARDRVLVLSTLCFGRLFFSFFWRVTATSVMPLLLHLLPNQQYTDTCSTVHIAYTTSCTVLVDITTYPTTATNRLHTCTH